MENIMDKISKTAISTYNNAAKVTGKIKKEIKLKAQMAENKRKIQELYEDIGKIVYEKYVLDEEINMKSDLLNNCAMIDILADEIEDIRMELLKLKDLKQCSKCHYEIYYDFHYCPNCGYTQEEQDKNEESNQNDTDATIVTTDGSDKDLKQHIDSFPAEEIIEEDE